MKKNTMMRIASVLLVVVLLTTSVISGTFAKYVTSGTGSDTARVAEFGVAIDAKGQTFKAAYQGIEAGWTSKNTVDAEGTNVVAPGTDGEMVSMELAGKPEVAVRVNYEANVAISSNWTEDVDGDGNATFYFPVIIKINNVAYSAAGTSCDTPAKFEKYLEDKIAEYSKEYAPNQNLADVSTHSLKISWEWPFEGEDAKDTWLGNQAAAGNPATVSITVKTTVTQID